MNMLNPDQCVVDKTHPRHAWFTAVEINGTQEVIAWHCPGKTAAGTTPDGPPA